jgi:hypothetical protein
VLDAQALSLLADEDEDEVAILDEARADRHAAAPSTVTIAGQRWSGKAGQRLRWPRSRTTVVAVTKQIADVAAGLLESTGLGDHQCTVDAPVVATPLRRVRQSGLKRWLTHSCRSRWAKLDGANRARLALLTGLSP